MIEIGRFITDSHKEDPKMVCISCVLSMARERSLVVSIGGFMEENRVKNELKVP